MLDGVNLLLALIGRRSSSELPGRDCTSEHVCLHTPLTYFKKYMTPEFSFFVTFRSHTYDNIQSAEQTAEALKKYLLFAARLI